MSDLLLYHFNAAEVRVIVRDGQPWWIANDVCRILDIHNARQAMSRLDDDEKGVILNDTLGGTQEFTAVNESGLYTLILRSRKPEAKAFRRWVTHDVLPAIRQHGFYTAVAVLQEEIAALHRQMTRQRDDFAETCSTLNEQRISHGQEATYWHLRCLSGWPYHPTKTKKPRHR